MKIKQGLFPPANKPFLYPFVLNQKEIRDICHGYKYLKSSPNYHIK